MTCGYQSLHIQMTGADTDELAIAGQRIVEMAAWQRTDTDSYSCH